MSVKEVQSAIAAHPVIEHTQNQKSVAFSNYVTSKLDPCVTVNVSKWAVTMVKEKVLFHVLLIFEGIWEENKPFFRIAHLQGPKSWCAPQEITNCFWGWSKTGVVKITDEKPHAELRIDEYGKKTETWLKPREKIELMIASILADKHREIPFSFFGQRSLLSRERECLDTSNKELQKLQKENPKQLVFLWELLKKKEQVEKLPKEDSFLKQADLLDVLDAKNKVGRCITVANHGVVGVSNLLWIVFLCHVAFGRFAKILMGLGSVGGVMRLNLFLYVKIREMMFKWTVARHERLLQLVKQHVHKANRLPNSCYTWAEEKLRVIEVAMPQGIVDRFIAVSSLYVEQNMASEDYRGICPVEFS